MSVAAGEAWVAAEVEGAERAWDARAATAMVAVVT